MKIGNADYSSNKVPRGYRCGKCGTNGVKLWRESHTFLNQQALTCVACLGVDDISKVTLNGRIDGDLGPTDQVGGKLPAVPCEEGSAFWGYTSVPWEGVAWWIKLPLVPGGPGGDPGPAPPPPPPRPRSYQIEEADFLVEATHNEQFEFWRRFASHWRGIPGDTIAAGDPKNRCKWEEINIGHCVQVGVLRTKRRRAALTKERPVVLTVFFARIEGFLVGFWEPTSQLVDHEMIREFIDKLGKPGCDAASFHPRRVVEACQRTKEKVNA